MAAPPAPLRGPVEVVGVDGLKLFDEIRKEHPSCIGDSDLSGVSQHFFRFIDAAVAKILGSFKAKKLVVCFDGLLMPQALKDHSFSEDLVMAGAWYLMRLRHEVIFAPYLAVSQLEVLKLTQHCQAVYHPNPPRVPGDLVLWNQSEGGPNQYNIHKCVPSLVRTPDEQTVIALMDSNATNERVRLQFVDKYAAVDAVESHPTLSLLMFTGIISPKLARALAYRVVESDGVSNTSNNKSALYEFMSVLLPLRAQIVHQLIAGMNTTPNDIQLKWDDQSHNTTPPLIELDNWRIEHSVGRLNGPRKVNHLRYLEAWSVTDVLQFEAQAVSAKEEVDIYTVAPTVILRSLDLMGYFTHAQEEQDQHHPQSQTESSSCSIYGSALKQFVGAPHLGEAAVLFIELVRTNAFNILKQGGGADGESGAASGEDNNNNNNTESVAASEAAAAAGQPGDAAAASNTGAGTTPAGAAGDAASAETRSASDNRSCEEVGIKIATIIPCATELNAEKCKRYDVQPHAQFIRASQAHTRSLRLLMEASAGNIVLREFTQNYHNQRAQYSLAAWADVLATLPAALPFTSPPSSRAFYMFSAVREFKTSAAIAEHFEVSAEEVEKDLQNMMLFVRLANNARACLSERDDDVGLDPATIEQVEPALEYLAASLGVALNNPSPAAQAPSS